ncbi:hypothetical protein GH714_010704 [Hevea brasiliensis]|uniref:Nas2 N-terminal domain-containing protein n=1 Tax=Hevea brasiliensis TaxID=3981 RepID=A0A6A6MXD7_HEVBR|nr:hypothetical protein GH714_010704 [Hevea brasiliensis]
MVATNLKAETMKLAEKRSSIEAEMNGIIERLCHPGGPGLSGNLVDAEGFPRADIDIPAVRAERNRLAVLRSDHKEITEKISENILALHSARLASRPSSRKDSGHDGASNNQDLSTGTAASASSHNVVLGEAPSSMDLDVIVSIPFAVVDEIADGSPTAEDGLQLGDQIVKFGSVEYKVGDNLLQCLATEAQANQGHAIPVVVLRQGAPFNVTVTPRAWQGRGLLGDCVEKHRRSLFMIGEIGGNDYNYGFFQGKSVNDLKSMVPNVVKAIKDAVMVR